LSPSESVASTHSWIRSATSAPAPTATGPSVLVASRSTTSRIVHVPSPNVSPSDFIASLGMISSGSSRLSGARSNPSHPDHRASVPSGSAMVRYRVLVFLGVGTTLATVGQALVLPRVNGPSWAPVQSVTTSWTVALGIARVPGLVIVLPFASVGRCLQYAWIGSTDPSAK
jgi:hypothetical protein